MYVFDGNSTIANAKNSGWKTIYVEMIDDPNDDFERGGKFKVGDVVEMTDKNKKFGYNSDYYIVEDKVGYDEKDFLISDVNKRESYTWGEDDFERKLNTYVKGGEVGNKFDYMMLGRLQNDVEYYLGHGARSPRVLYYRDSPKEHIEAMKEIWNRLPIKPEWLPKEKLDFYEMQLLSDLS
jgi:hypothetical protein